MQIDWLTVAAQIVNFLVLVWLLQRFLYKPISTAMRRREERIRDRLAEASATRDEVERQARNLKEQAAELEASRDDILASAHAEADELRARLTTEIRTEMEERRETWHAHLAAEREAFVASLQRQAGRQILDISGRVLADFADSEIAERVAATFAIRLGSLDPDIRRKLAEAATMAQAAIVETSDALASAAKGRMTRAIHEALSTDIEVDYREDAGLVVGVRLTIGEVTAEWSANRHLDRLKTELDEIIDAGSHAAPRKVEDGEDARGASTWDR